MTNLRFWLLIGLVTSALAVAPAAAQEAGDAGAMHAAEAVRGASTHRVPDEEDRNAHTDQGQRAEQPVGPLAAPLGGDHARQES